MKISYQLNLAELPKITRAMKAELEKQLRNNVSVATTQSSRQAKANVKVVHSGIKSSILKLVKGLTGEVWVRAEYAPYVDFGTGSEIQIPSDWKDVAIEFKGAGIREVNNKAQPYFYPAVDRQKHIFEKANEKALERVMNKRR